MTKFLVWGGGGHGKVVADAIRAAGGLVVGYVDGDPAKLGRQVEPGGGRVLMAEVDFLALLDGDEPLPDGVDAVALAIGDNRRRLECFHRLRERMAPPIVHPSAVVSPSVTIGDGTVVMAGVVLNADAQIGRAVIVNTASVVEHDCSIGDGVHLAPRSVLGGGVRIGTRSWVGAGSTIIQLIAVGAETRIGAGAAVVEDVDDGLTVAGVPARPLESREKRAKQG